MPRAACARTNCPRLTAPSILCVQAGNVNSGAFDPFEPLCAAARDAGAWIHVDGAFGLWARASGALSHLTHGLELRRFLGHRCAQVAQRALRQRLAFVRDARSAAVPRWPSRPNTCRTEARAATLRTSRRSCRAARAASRSGRRCSRLGRAGLAAMIERNCAQARRFAEGLAAAGFEILNDVVLNQVLVSLRRRGTHRRVIEAIQRDGTCWAGITVWQGQTACASASLPGRPPMTTSIAASRPCFAAPANVARQTRAARTGSNMLPGRLPPLWRGRAPRQPI